MASTLIRDFPGGLLGRRRGGGDVLEDLPDLRGVLGDLLENGSADSHLVAALALERFDDAVERQGAVLGLERLANL
jgi:hypothetical protein